MILWQEAKNLSANEFGELMLAYIGGSMSSQNLMLSLNQQF